MYLNSVNIFLYIFCKGKRKKQEQQNKMNKMVTFISEATCQKNIRTKKLNLGHKKKLKDGDVKDQTRGWVTSSIMWLTKNFVTDTVSCQAHSGTGCKSLAISHFGVLLHYMEIVWIAL